MPSIAQFRLGTLAGLGAVALVATPMLVSAPAVADEQAAGLLARTHERLVKADAVAVTAKQTVDLKAPGAEQNIEMTYQYAIARPAKIAIRNTDQRMGMTIRSDGETMLVHAPNVDAYATADAPGDIATWCDPMALMPYGQLDPGPLAFMRPMFDADAYDAMAKKVMDGTIPVENVGTESLDGIETTHLKAMMPAESIPGLSQQMPFAAEARFPFHYWVTTGETPTLVKFSPDLQPAYDLAAEQGMPGAGDMSIEIAVHFSDWAFGSDVKASHFDVSPPKGATAKADVNAVVQALMQGPDPMSLIGEEAPSFVLDLLEGGRLDLAKHRGNEVVVLDFWATWCGPCVRGLPTVTKVIDSFEGQGVAFYAVNLEEKPQKVREFMASKGWSFPVAMDVKGDVATMFNVSGIPQSVIIGKDGRIKVVHVGFDLSNPAGVEKMLTDEIQAVLDGRDPASAEG